MADSLLVNLFKKGISLDALKKEAIVAFLPIVEIVKLSPTNCEERKKLWQYKSLAQFSIEKISDMSPNVDDKDLNHVLDRISKILSSMIVSFINLNDEGLRLYVNDSGSFRIANETDADFLYMKRLGHEGLTLDLIYLEPPTWAQNLFLNARAFEVYNWFYHSEFESSKYDFIKKVKADAIARILDGDVDQDFYNAKQAEIIEKPLNDSERKSMIKIMHALAKNGYKYPNHGALADIVKDFQTYNNGVTENTLTKYLKEFDRL